MIGTKTCMHHNASILDKFKDISLNKITICHATYIAIVTRHFNFSVTAYDKIS